MRIMCYLLIELDVVYHHHQILLLLPCGLRSMKMQPRNGFILTFLFALSATSEDECSCTSCMQYNFVLYVCTECVHTYSHLARCTKSTACLLLTSSSSLNSHSLHEITDVSQILS